MNTKTSAVLLLVAAGFLAGCGDQNTPAESFFKTGKWRFLSPEKNIAKPDQAELGWIIESVGELDPSEEMYPNATRPKPEDWVYADEDYVIGPTDILDISILDLYAEGLETMLRREVSDSGYIDLPQVKQRIRAEEMTQQQLVAAIQEAYRQAGILRDPVVSVTIAARRQQTFSVMGSVNRPGTYNIVRRDMRLLDALALSGGVAGDQYIDYVYVIRQAPAIPKSQVPVGSSARPGDDNQGVEVRQGPGDLKDVDGMLPGSPEARQTLVHFAETGGATGPAPSSAPTTADAAGLAEAIQDPTTTAPAGKASHRWVYRDGQWVRQEVTDTAPASQPEVAIPASPSTAPQPVAEADEPQRTLPAMPGLKPEPSASDPFGWADMEKQDLVRVIAINLKKLQQGDYRQNIVVRENDVIQIPSVEVGEFYIMGEVSRPGVYSLTGREITIKQALSAAGNLGPLAWPENSVLIRRIGKNQEQIIPLNIEKIIRGTDPDLYLKPDDVVAVGTAWQSTFLAVLRNAFRMTYGFGFIYDRNFADPLTIYPNSKRFKGL